MNRNSLFFVDFRIEFPPSVSIWIEIILTYQISKKKLFLERQSCCKNFISKILYLVNFHRKNVKVSFFLCIFATVVLEKCFLLIKNFWIKIFFKKSVLNHFLYNASYSESRHSNASDLEPFFYPSTIVESKNLERVRFRKKKSYDESHFEMNLICTKTNFYEWFAWRKLLFDPFTPQNAKFFRYAFSQKPWYGEKMEKEQFLNQDFWKESDFETGFQQRVRFWIKSFKIRHIFWRDFHNSPDFKSKYLLRVEYWIEFQHSVEIWSTIFTLHPISKKKLFFRTSKLL